MFERLETASAREVIEWAFEAFGEGLALSTAFGPSGVALMHLVSQSHPGARVFFVDTGYHFAETLQMVDRIRARLPLDLQVLQPAQGVRALEGAHGGPLHRLDTDACCARRKVAPTQRMLDGLDAWMTGLRRDQGPSRRGTPVVERKPRGGRVLFKVNPLARWTSQDVWRHIFAHDLPYNPLHDQGYPSVGCAPCTRPATDLADERSGRWAGSAKTECGLHTLL